MTLSTRTTGTLNQVNIYIVFLPNGSLDTSRMPQSDIDHVNSFLAPTISNLHVQLNTTGFDFWELINWLYVSYYWTVLVDFGQTTPTIVYDNDTATAPLTSTNNIFLNQTLFSSYQSYLRTTVLPLLNGTDVWNHQFPDFPPFQDVNSSNPLSDFGKSFVRGYPCVLRSRKKWLSLIISVIVADYALIMSAYKVALFLGLEIEKRRRPDCECPSM